MKPPWLLLAALCVCPPIQADGQDPDFAARLDAAMLAAVQPILDAAERDSLPTQALRSKILEGMAKGVLSGRITQVVADLADEFRAARAALRAGLPGRLPGDGEVVAAALARRQGVAFEVVQSLLASRPDGGSLEIPVTILSELVRRGIAVEEASAVMAHVVRTSVPMRVAAQIPGKFDGAVASGSPRAVALVDALRTLNIPDPPGRRPNE